MVVKCAVLWWSQDNLKHRNPYLNEDVTLKKKKKPRVAQETRFFLF